MKQLLVIILCVLTFACTQTQTEKPKFTVGANVKIESSGQSTVVATDRESLDKLVKVGTAKNKEAYDALILSGKIFSVDNGTKAWIRIRLYIK